MTKKGEEMLFANFDLCSTIKTFSNNSYRFALKIRRDFSTFTELIVFLNFGYSTVKVRNVIELRINHVFFCSSKSFFC